MTVRHPAGRVSVAIGALIAAIGAAGLARSGRPIGLTSFDGTALTAMLYEASSRPAPGIILVHMLGRSKDEWGGFAEHLQAAGATVLALDLRGHGNSAGNGSMLAEMVGDVRAAMDWLALRPSIRSGSLALVGASLGANLVANAAADAPGVRGVALLSASQDYRGVRIDLALMKKLSSRPVWMAASTQDPYALRTISELSAGNAAVEQRLSTSRAHGTLLLNMDEELRRALVDWLRRTLVF